MRIVRILLASALMLVLSPAEPVAMAAPSRQVAVRIPRTPKSAAASNIVPGHLIVGFTSAPTTAAVVAVAASADSSESAVKPLHGHAVDWKVPRGQSDAQFARKLEASGRVAYASPVYVRHIASYVPPAYVAPNDTEFVDPHAYKSTIGSTVYNYGPYSRSWGLREMNAPTAWQTGFTGPDIVGKFPLRAPATSFTIGVIDTGAFLNHPDNSSGNIVAGYDFFDHTDASGNLIGDNNVTPNTSSANAGGVYDWSHGTCVSGEIAATANNGIGTLGAGMDLKVRVYKVEGLYSAGSGSLNGTVGIDDRALFSAIERAADDGCKVINMSLGGPDPSSAEQTAITYAYSKGCVIVAAKGNDGTNAGFYPAADQHVIAVGALDKDVNSTTIPADYSNYFNATLQVMAPGSSIRGLIQPTYLDPTDPVGLTGYSWWDGTSMATPMVSGAFAFLWRAAPALTNAEITSEILGAAAHHTTSDPHYPSGFDEIDMGAAYAKLEADYPLLTNPTVSVPATHTPGSIPANWTPNPAGARGVTYDVLLDGNKILSGTSATSTLLSNVGVGSHSLKVVPHSAYNWEDGTASSTVLFTVAGPATTLQSDPAPNSFGWNNRDVSVTLSATDTISNVTATYYRINSGAATTYTAPFTITPEGTNTVYYWSVDALGNTEGVKSTAVRIDRTPPHTASNAAASYIGAGHLVTLSPSDPLSGVGSTHWSMDSGTLNTGVTVGVPNTPGTHTLQFRSTDRAGNVESTQTVTFKVAALTRIGGIDRYAVAENLARAGWDPTSAKSWTGLHDVIIACGDPGKEADPLSAAGLAGVYNAPVLLVKTASTPAAVKTIVAEIAKKNAPVTIHVVGGAASVPNARVNELTAIAGVNKTVDRLAGPDRYAVSASVAIRMVSRRGVAGIPGVLLVAGDNVNAFYDALAASPAAYAAHLPMLSVRKSGIPGTVGSVLSGALRGKPRYAVSSSAYLGSSALGATHLTGSANRYVSAGDIARAATAHSWLTNADLGLAAKLPDALTGGAFMGRLGGVMLFTDSTSKLQPAPSAYITATKASVSYTWIFGGDASVTATAENRVGQLLLQ